MQNSLPSGSARTTQPVPGPYFPRRSFTTLAPWAKFLNLSVAGVNAWAEVEVKAVLAAPVFRFRGVWDLHEQQLVPRLRIADHALLVAGLVGVVLDVGVAEHDLPPL